LYRCALGHKRSSSRHIDASGLIAGAAGCVLLVAALALAGAYGIAAPEALSLAAYTGSQAPVTRLSTQLPVHKPTTRHAPTAAAPPAALRGVPATTSQAVLVNAPNASSTTAMIETWQRAGNGWKPILGPVRAHIGADGIGRASESTSRTPAGLFSLTQTFGRGANPGTRQPWFHASGQSTRALARRSSSTSPMAALRRDASRLTGPW
jgi:hypothetical protein